MGKPAVTLGILVAATSQEGAENNGDLLFICVVCYELRIRTNLEGGGQVINGTMVGEKERERGGRERERERERESKSFKTKLVD